MPDVTERCSVAVIGGGVIGSTVAWTLAEAGHRVTLYTDRAVEQSTTWVAGGMLAPWSEAWPGDSGLLDLSLASMRAWPGFAARLEQDEHRVITARGSLAVAADEGDVADLHRVMAWLEARGEPVAPLSRREARALEPGLAAGLRPVFQVQDELAVDNRATLLALRELAVRAGATIEQRRISSLASLPQDQVVVAAGPWTSELLPALRVRPVKGEIMRLARRSFSAPPPRRIVRGWVRGRHVYLVPRPDGMVVGATQHEAGFDTTVTAGGVRDLLADAEAVFPGVADYAITDMSAGLRPVTPDNIPLIGRVDDRTLVAAGHGRNGMLLAPLTGSAILAELDGQPLAEAAAAHPRRFA
ncbi:glycine oxidase ThiO [Hoyosella sp. G463]|uniref:glycine oxidase n=1 Tax=Lolliginicoccus lacisalsi TaxID=2742202 RepID=A0A927PN10_9ACTN|nr:glycine oxidase ThiO [Lolliginicoccus lacisalsi]MBD8507397.1 glycine oxidase ThiO [Lolliginicoccus lacisalsi]